MANKGKLGALNKIKKGITAASDEAYVDPASKHLGDWAWKPLKEVTAKLDVTEVPDYVQKGYGDFMKMQAARAAAGNLSKRDLAKAFGITQSSIGRGGLPHASATKAGLKVPNTGELVRPEGAFAEWLGSKMGQRYLKAAERGEIDQAAIADIQAKFSPFGKPNQLAEQLAYGATDLVQRPEDISKIVGGDKEAFRDFAQSIRGINQAKAGFIGSLLGRGDLPTLDARQLNLHTLPPESVKVESVMKRGKHAGAREAVDRLIARQEAMGLDLDPSLDPFYQHLTHHAVWDKSADSKTTHDDLVRAMRGYSGGGLAHLAKGGGKLGAIKRMGQGIADVSNEADQMMPAAGGLRFADAPRGGPSIIKEKGGNWLGGVMDLDLKPLKRKVATENIANYTPEQIKRLMKSGSLPRNDALNNWVDRNLTNYIKNQMATADDPVRRLAEEGVVHMPPRNTQFSDVEIHRQRQGYPKEGVGVSPEAQSWERLSDDAVRSRKAKNLIDTNEMGSLMPMYRNDEAKTNLKENPWLSKVDPETKIYNVTGLNALGFDHIVDVLKEDLAAGRIRPEQLNKISMEQAVRRTHAYDQQKAEEMAKTAIKNTEGMPTHKEYPEGYKWIELAKPDLKELPEGYRIEYTTQNTPYLVNKDGVSLGYMEEGKEHAQALDRLAEEKLADALDYEGKTMGHCVGGYCPDVIEGRTRIYSLRDTKGEPHVTIEVQPMRGSELGRYAADLPEGEDVAAMKNPPLMIKQIKGKGNARPIEKYDPYTQDFVKGGDWSDVGDLHHTGLRRTKDVFNDTELAFLKSKGVDLNLYIEPQETARYQELFKQTPPAEGMRDGGAVNPGQHDYNDGGAAFGVYPKAGMEPKSKSDEHLKRMVAIAKEHLAETNRKIRKNGVGDMIRHSLIAPAIGGASDILNLPLELVDYAQSQVPALSEPESVLAMYDRKQTSPHAQTEWDTKAKYPAASDKPFMGTADVRERMAKYGVTTGDEYPFYDQFGEFVVDPFIGYKVLKAGYKGAKKARGALQTIKP